MAGTGGGKVGLMPPADSLRLPLDHQAPSRARRWLASAVKLDPVRLAEAGLLISEVITPMVGEFGDDSQLTVGVEQHSLGIRVAVKPPRGVFVALEGDELRSRLLGRLSRNWGRDKDEIWFEVRKPGAMGEALSSLAEDELMARALDDDDAREEVARRFMPLALGICRRYRGKGISEDDLEQVAMLGMLRALERYDPSIGSFEPYAARTISGELKKHLRDRAWSVRLPRSLQERALEVTRTSQELTQKLGRTPDPGDIAKALDISPEEVLEAMGAASAYTSSSLDAPVGESGWTIADGLGMEDIDVALAEKWQGVGAAIATLPERERQILYYRFHEDMTQTEIAELVGISQMHVSRLLARALERLRTLLAD